MNGKVHCERYRKYFIMEVKGNLPFLSLWEKINNLPPTPLFDNKAERKKWSRFIYTRDMPIWSYPPYCRYGYYCRDSCLFNIWKKKTVPIQLTLF